jgi:Amidase
LAGHRDDFPPEYLRWVDERYELHRADLIRDEEVRSETYDAIQSVLEEHELLVTPTLACLRVENATDGNTKGPTEVNGVEVDPLIGWCLTYPATFSGHPAASIPAGMAEGDLPVGMQLIGRRYADTDLLSASAALSACARGVTATASPRPAERAGSAAGPTACPENCHAPVGCRVWHAARTSCFDTRANRRTSGSSAGPCSFCLRWSINARCGR